MTKTITLQTVKGIDFGFHIEGKDIVIDQCEGITPEQGMSLFDPWIIDLMMEKK